MVQLNGLKLPIRFRIKDDNLRDELVKYFKEHKKLKPARFGYTVEYAESLEYGTGPLSQYQPTVHGGDYSYRTIYNEIYEWAGKKDGHGSGLPIEDEEERKRFAKAVTDRFFTIGMKPHPYFRPAVQFLEDNEQRLFDEGLSLRDICDEALRVANKAIMDQNLPFTGKLQLSAIVEEVDWDEIGDVKMIKDYTEDERNKKTDDLGWKE